MPWKTTPNVGGWGVVSTLNGSTGRLAILIASVAAAVTGCGTGEPAPTAKFGGVEYLANTPVGVVITDVDLTPIGEADAIGETLHVRDRIVFALRGVDPRKILMMRAAEPQTDGPWVMLIGEGTLSGSGPTELFDTVPELCQYFPNEAGCN